MVASVLATGWDRDQDRDDGQHDSVGALAARAAYEAAGIDPRDLSCVELHDASAPSELIAYEYLGLCAEGAGASLLAAGDTRLGGRIPVNVSGGLLRKGHPVGATGCAQIVELTEQLQGRSGARQVEGARIALAHNGGGAIGVDAAVTVVTILQRE
jgi:acetyl-CoA acetyltransferase